MKMIMNKNKNLFNKVGWNIKANKINLIWWDYLWYWTKIPANWLKDKKTNKNNFLVTFTVKLIPQEISPFNAIKNHKKIN